ncbi:hypothetical protein CEXT_127921 [Caerostris extrusa]|uniref:Uncharacterized protein n=1 Tax=Caerostris extrusa TaxID=172846 RepID=A0AAV4SRS7_CAEEX|nr:hypothetical protein CEXT_127921 [Caerostris extrusa]
MFLPKLSNLHPLTPISHFCKPFYSSFRPPYLLPYNSRKIPHEKFSNVSHVSSSHGNTPGGVPGLFRRALSPDVLPLSPFPGFLLQRQTRYLLRPLGVCCPRDKLGGSFSRDGVRGLGCNFFFFVILSDPFSL